MNRKDCIILASALRDAFQKEEMNYKYLPDGQAPPTSVDGLHTAACSIAAALSVDNLQFNHNHFLAVVRGGKDLNSRPCRRTDG